MSIFKESFKKFVQKQIAVREKINSIGNKGEDRFKSNKKSFKALRKNKRRK